MNTTIDNFDQIKSLMAFGESDNLFLHLQILRRGKDHPGLPAANRLIKAWLVRSAEHLDSLRDEVVFLCEHYKARAYISCVPKSIEKLNMLIIRKLADNQYTGNVINPWHVFNSACGELPGVEKRWVVDIDTKNEIEIASISAVIDMAWLKAHPEDKDKVREDLWLIGQLPTMNGVHLLTRPFNLQIFHKHFPNTKVKKNGLTALYVPQCICEKYDTPHPDTRRLPITHRKEDGMIETKLSVNAIELAIAQMFGIRNNIIVPNVSWGFFATHEADLVIINKTGYMTEVEIKRSWQDFLNDFKKHTTHDEGKVMWKYFAVPESMSEKVWQYLCDNGHKDWGVIAYNEIGGAWIVRYPNNHGHSNPSKKLFLEEKLAIARLGCMRIWKLKEKLIEL